MSSGLYARLSCHLPDEPEIAEAGDLAELVFYRTILRCREFLTDGIIDRRVLTRWYGGIRGKPADHLDRLVDVGYLEHCEQGWRIPFDIWCEWNPTKAEVEAKREAAAERQRLSRERRRASHADVTRDNPVSHRQPKPEPKRRVLTSPRSFTSGAPKPGDKSIEATVTDLATRFRA